MTLTLLLSWMIVSLIGLPLLLALCIPADFWRWAGRIKRWLRQDVARRYGQRRADELLGPPLPYEFFE